MTEQTEHEPTAPPACEPRDVWWGAIVDALLEELKTPREEPGER